MKTGNRPRRSGVAVCVLAAAAAMIAAGCSSNASGSSASSGAAGTAKVDLGPTSAPTKSTVRVMLENLGPATAGALAALNQPDVDTVVKAEVENVNAHGGSDGHKIQLDVCYDQGDPNLAAACARTAVSNHDVAVLAPVVIDSGNTLPILEKAGIPYFAAEPLSPADFTNPDAYPISGGLPVEFFGLSHLLAKNGCKRLGIVYTAAPAPELGVPFITQAAQAYGMKVVASVSIAATSVNAAPQVAQITHANADCMALSLFNNQSTPVVLAARQTAPNLTIGGLTSEFPSSVLNSLGSSGNGVLLSGSSALPSDTSNAQVEKMLAVTTTYEPKMTQPYSAFAVKAWAGSQMLFNDVIPSIQGDVTAASVTAAIRALKDASTGVTAPYTASAPAPVAKFPRLINYGVTSWKIENGKPQSTLTGFTDVAPAQ